MAHRTGPSSPPRFFQGDGKAAQSHGLPKVLSYPCMQHGAEAAVGTSHPTPSMRLMPCVRNPLSASLLLHCILAPAQPCNWWPTLRPQPVGWPWPILISTNFPMTWVWSNHCFTKPFFSPSAIAVECWRWLGMPEVLQFPRRKLVKVQRHQLVAVVPSNKTR